MAHFFIQDESSGVIDGFRMQGNLRGVGLVFKSENHVEMDSHKTEKGMEVMVDRDLICELFDKKDKYYQNYMRTEIINSTWYMIEQEDYETLFKGNSRKVIEGMGKNEFTKNLIIVDEKSYVCRRFPGHDLIGIYPNIYE